jgi:hypothetical protein
MTDSSDDFITDKVSIYFEYFSRYFFYDLASFIPLDYAVYYFVSHNIAGIIRVKSFYSYLTCLAFEIDQNRKSTQDVFCTAELQWIQEPIHKSLSTINSLVLFESLACLYNVCCSDI